MSESEFNLMTEMQTNWSMKKCSDVQDALQKVECIFQSKGCTDGVAEVD